MSNIGLMVAVTVSILSPDIDNIKNTFHVTNSNALLGCYEDFVALDADADGLLSRDEFSVGIHPHSFEWYDTDSNGYLDSAEFTKDCARK